MFASCQQQKQTPAQEQKQAQDSLRQAKTWQLDEAVDEFGEPNGNKFVKLLATGTFSNSATNNSPLSVIVTVEQDSTVKFFFIEYNKHMAKGKDVLLYSIKQSNGEVIKGMCWNNDRGQTAVHPWSGTGYPNSDNNTVYNALAAGGKVMFSFETSKAPFTQYKFAIENADGLQEALLGAK